jgi:hypothetical protein
MLAVVVSRPMLEEPGILPARFGCIPLISPRHVHIRTGIARKSANYSLTFHICGQAGTSLKNLMPKSCMYFKGLLHDIFYSRPEQEQLLVFKFQRGYFDLRQPFLVLMHFRPNLL